MSRYKTTKNDFDEFKKECWYWIEYFGLKSYDWDIQHEDIEESGARASYNLTYTARYVKVILNTSFAVSPFKNEIKLCAFHEVCHVLLAGIAQMAFTLFRNDNVEVEEHKIITILENTLFKEKRGDWNGEPHAFL